MSEHSHELIPLCVPEIRGNEGAYIKECLDTNWISSVGAYVDRFENDLAARVDTSHAVATVNGTAALHIALLLADVKPGDEVLVSTLTFIAPANAIRYVGAWPVFMDADPVYWQMDPDKAKDFLEQECKLDGGVLCNKTTGRRVKAIIPVHVLGHPVDMDPILELAERFNIIVIEDATEGLGATHKGRRAGGMGDAGCFSFNGNKLITTGGGGMITTNNSDWARRAKYLTTQAKDDPIEYIHGEIGYNYRPTNIQAAMGCAQMEKLDEYIAAKRRIAQTYATAFEGVPGISPMKESNDAFSVYWMYTVLVDREKYGMDSRELLRLFGESNIQTRPLWQPLHMSPAHLSCQSYHCDAAERLHRDALSLPCSVGLTEEQQDGVISVIHENADRTGTAK
ncbi:LegC family aminotransferase [Candidatus Hydrogenedentota bacterium]